MGEQKFKVGDRVTNNDTTRVDVEEHWNAYFRLSQGEIIDGALVVASVLDRASGSNIGLSNKVGRPLFYMPESTLKFAEPATLKIEAGKFYETRDGRKVGPAIITGDCAVFGDRSNYASAVWANNGRSSHRDDKTSLKDNDIIAEWIDEPVASDGYDTWFRAKVQESLDDTRPTLPHAQVMQSINSRIDAEIKPSNDNAKPKFKVGDRVNCRNVGGAEEYDHAVGTIAEDDENPPLRYKVTLDKPIKKWGDTYLWCSDETLTLLEAPTTTIVALIENGQPKPSSTPHIHASTGAAEKEAKRLAAKFKGKQFGVFTLTTTHEEAAPVYGHKWQNMAAMGLKIDAIKELRSITGMGLKPAKDAVEYFLAAA